MMHDLAISYYTLDYSAKYSAQSFYINYSFCCKNVIVKKFCGIFAL